MTRPNGPWVATIEALVSRIESGMRVSAGGVHMTRVPVAALRALVASQPRDLTYVAWGGGLALELMISQGCVARAEICFSNADVFGLAPRFRKAAELGSIQVLDRTALQLLTGLRARSERLAWQPMQAPTGTTFDDPDRGIDAYPPAQEVDAIQIDAVLLHAQRADEDGNVEIEGARATDVLVALAADQVLVTVEERVPRGTLNARSSFIIPRDRVTAVALSPSGAWPTSCFPFYTQDVEAFGRAMLAPDADTLLAEATPRPSAVDAPPTCESKHITAAVRSALSASSSTPWTIDELMVTWLASTVNDQSVCTCGSASPLAATAYMLAKRTHAPACLIMSMNGCYVDVDERPVTLTWADYQDYLSAALHCGSEDTYRWYYQPGRITHEAVGAAQIDAYGRTNNLWLDKPSGGRIRLPGQGGMADVANLHSDFLIYLPRHSRLATTEQVSLVSSNRAWFDHQLRAKYGYTTGRTAILTDLCVMEPTGPGGRLQVTQLHPGVEFEAVVEATGFSVELAPTWTRTPIPEEAQLRILREEVDPLGVRRLEFVPARERGDLLRDLLKRERELVHAMKTYSITTRTSAE